MINKYTLLIYLFIFPFIISFLHKKKGIENHLFVKFYTLFAQVYYAFLATSTNLAKAAISLTAKSANILRSTATPALVKPAMKRL